jgi:hypothetical protein
MVRRRRSLARFSEPEASDHTPSLADFITTTPELKFSVHTGVVWQIAMLVGAGIALTVFSASDIF